jgi:hypothetical protein
MNSSLRTNDLPFSIQENQIFQRTPVDGESPELVEFKLSSSICQSQAAESEKKLINEIISDDLNSTLLIPENQIDKVFTTKTYSK